MPKFSPLLGMSFGIALVALAMFALPFAVAARQDPRAPEAAPYNCPVAQIAIDRGYGLSRIEARNMCWGRDW